MKVILKKDIPNIGRKDEVKEVHDGFARNFLLARNLAIAATPDNIKIYEMKEQMQAAKKEHERAHYERMAEQISKMSLTFKIKVGEKGKAFGSIGAAKIQEELKKRKIAVEKEWIQCDHLKTTGGHDVTVAFPQNIEAKLNVMIEAE